MRLLLFLPPRLLATGLLAAFSFSMSVFTPLTLRRWRLLVALSGHLRLNESLELAHGYAPRLTDLAAANRSLSHEREEPRTMEAEHGCRRFYVHQ